MAIEYALESVGDVWDEIQPLIAEHWREIAHFDDIPLMPREGVFHGLQAAGIIRVFTARLDDRLIGYAVFIVDFSVHYATSLQAKQDVLFLLPEFRNAGNGAALIQYCDQSLAAEGVQCVYHHVKLAHNFGPLLEALGYQAVETIHVKRLDHGS